ncbi:hypothetical protein, partial [Streptomyces turgidiscabies]|uniref:hypothetical protein n=1 Tax=Streptomyces turgidiscabies TaxID=85558 RepID=UPI0038F6B0E0
RSDDRGVGSNKRYPYLGGKLAEERELRAAAKGTPVSTKGSPTQLRGYAFTYLRERASMSSRGPAER